MATCSFCGKAIPQGTGTMYIRKDAKVSWFCSNKCGKNLLKLNRKPRHKAWTEEYKHAKNAAMAAASHKGEPVAKERAKDRKQEKKRSRPVKEAGDEE